SSAKPVALQRAECTLSSSFFGNGQPEQEGSAASGFALDVDPSAVCFGDAAGDGESQTGAAAAVSLGVPETVEDVRQILDGYSRPLDADANHARAIPPLGRHLDRATLRRELHRIADEVRQRLQNAEAVAANAQILGGGDLDPLALLRRLLGKDAACLLEQRS